MTRLKKNVSKKPQPKKTKAIPKDPRIESIYEKEITFVCPVRGIVTQKVQVKRYKTPGQADPASLSVPMSEFVDTLDENVNDLSIYDNGEDLGVTDVPEGDK